jgi:hypothetical protein
MLCTINPAVGNHSGGDTRTNHFNVLASIHAIATAAAGSTPSNAPVNTSGTRNNSLECITVISNTEAGGWLAGTSNNFTNAATFNISAGVQWLDLYRASGKTSFPYYRVAIGNPEYPFNSSFTSYPTAKWIAGCTSDNPTTTAVTSSNHFYINPNSSQYTSGATALACNVAGTSNDHRLRFDESRTYTVACTANYLIIVSSDYLFYFGLRTVGGWELSRADNPPWVCFAYTRRNLNTGIHAGTSNSNSNGHTDHAAAWAATINASGTQVAAATTTGLYGHRCAATTNACSLTGMDGYNFVRPSGGSGALHTSRILRTPLFQTSLPSNWGQFTSANSYSFYSDGVVADTSTGLSVPPVYPVVFSMSNAPSEAFAIGTAQGIFKGMMGSATMTDYFITGSSYTIAGETYIPVRTGHQTYKDVWFLRAA